MLIITKTVGTNFTIVDDSQTISMFNGTAVVNIPKVVFTGSLETITRKVQIDTDNITGLNTQLTGLQSQLAQDTAILQVIQSVPAPVVPPTN